MPASSKVKQLTERCVREARHGGRPCWAQKLEGDAKLFVDELQKMKDAGKEFSMEEAVKIMHEFGVDIQVSAMRKHIVRKCRCEKIKR